MKTTIHHMYADIWLQIFEYFNIVELFTSFLNVTRTSDEILFYKSKYIYFRQLVLDAQIQDLPMNFPLDQVISLELHEACCIDIIRQCTQLQSLKLIGQSKWIAFILQKVLQIEINLKQLVLVLPGIHSLPEIFSSVLSKFPLHRLEIYANELEQEMKIENCFPTQTHVKQFLLDTCSSISTDELAYILSIFHTIHFLNITLFYDKTRTLSLPILPNLQYICLKLFEVPFEWIIDVVRIAPMLTKLKLSGLINGDGFIIDPRWIHLFQKCPLLSRVTVNVSLQSDVCFVLNEMSRKALQEINLDLISIDDDSDVFDSNINEQRWLKLSGTIFRDCIHL